MKGRPNKYKSHVEPRLDEIAEMCLTMTEKQIAECLGVGYTAWKQYKKEFPPLLSALKKGRENLVKDLKSTLIRKAHGFQYEERKIVKEDGKVVKEEIMIKSALPDVASINLLLKNYDEEWSNDPQAYELKKRELELRERQVEANLF